MYRTFDQNFNFGMDPQKNPISVASMIESIDEKSLSYVISRETTKKIIHAIMA